MKTNCFTKLEIDNFITKDAKIMSSVKIAYKYSDYYTALNKIILDQSLKFSNPSIFNDPFDCNEKIIKINITKKGMDNLLLTLPIDLKDKKNDIINYINNSDAFINERKKYKISCFSKNYDNVLMWSHYADKHSGICLGFDFPKIQSDDFIICPVKYLNEIKPISGDADTNKVILFWLTSKSAAWKYENEFRAITKSDENAEFIIKKYNTKYLKEIIFGCNVSENKIIEFINLIRKNDFNNLTFKQMKIDKSKFLLKEELLNI